MLLASHIATTDFYRLHQYQILVHLIFCRLFVCLFVLSYANLMHPVRALCGGCCVSLRARFRCQAAPSWRHLLNYQIPELLPGPLGAGSSLLPGGDILSCSKISDSEISKSSESCSSDLILNSREAHYLSCTILIVLTSIPEVLPVA